MDIYEESLIVHMRHKGKIAISAKIPVKTRKDLSIAYTPGVAAPCKEIAKDKDKVYDYTFKENTVAVVSDGTAVLGLGNIGPEAGLPVMEGKALLFKEFAGIDAFPICLATQDPDEIIKTVRYIAPAFGGINLEDIAAPNCFRIERELQDLGIPVFHDDQHGTAVVAFAAVMNAAKVVKKELKSLSVVISGAGAAGTAVANLLVPNVQSVIVCDTKGAIFEGREHLNDEKRKLASITNKKKLKGLLLEAIKGADVFIGVSQPKVMTKEMVSSMNKNAIVIAMSNPEPEIFPDEAKEGGAAVVATGRSDFPNQVNNVLAFPGIFKGALSVRAPVITEKMKKAAAFALAGYVKTPTADNILPDPLDKNVANVVAEAVRKASGRKIVE